MELRKHIPCDLPALLACVGFRETLLAKVQEEPWYGGEQESGVDHQRTAQTARANSHDSPSVVRDNGLNVGVGLRHPFPALCYLHYSIPECGNDSVEGKYWVLKVP